MGFHSVNFLTIRACSILTIRPNHFSRCAFINLTIPVRGAYYLHYQYSWQHSTTQKTATFKLAAVRTWNLTQCS
jgi:hypothetical protein